MTQNNTGAPSHTERYVPSQQTLHPAFQVLGCNSINSWSVIGLFMLITRP